MKTRPHYFRTRFIAGMLIGALVTPFFFFAPAEKARAALPGPQPVIEIGPQLGMVTAIAAAQTTDRFKQDVLDPMAVLLARAAIRVLTASIVNWINSGFKGNPAFVTDLNGFLREVADQAIGEFIYGSQLAFLCSPFQLDVRISLLKTFARPTKAACRLSDITKNIDNFLNRSFLSGGLPAWYVMVTDPYGNPYNAYVNSSLGLRARILGARGEQIQLLNFSSGFFSLMECNDYGDAGNRRTTTTYGYDKKPGQECQIVTPGKAIEGTLQNQLGTDLRQLELANSFNQIFDALIGQLIRSVLLGGGGLRGASRSSSSSGSFLQQYTNTVNTGGLEKVKRDFIDSVSKDVKNETDYRAAKTTSLASAGEAGVLLGELYACYAGKLSGTALSTSERAVAQGRMASATSTVALKIEPSKTEFSANIGSANINIGVLNDFIDRAAKVKAELELDRPAREFSALRASGRLHDLRAVADAQSQRDAVVAEMTALTEQTRQDIETCTAFPGIPGGSTGS